MLTGVNMKQNKTDVQKKTSSERLDSVVKDAVKSRAAREQGYREQSLRIHPWICGRCSREFIRTNIHELTVHHKDHNHDNNPADGSNWENLCLYCHDNEHSRYLDHQASAGLELGGKVQTESSHQPFADLSKLLKG